ncbi:outer membrane protein transport protein [bacterium]|nr:outer membrane protein transport protein [bacterium]NUN46947.1 outer membrane protein transport protein [bacterium]
MKFLSYGMSLFFYSFILLAQNENNAVRPFMNEFGPGARALGLGGAYSAIAEDYTAVYWNPAGLAQIRKMEFYTAFAHRNNTNAITYQGTRTETSNGFTSMNALGFVFPVPTTRGSLVLAFGFHRVNSFDDYNRVTGSPMIGNISFDQDEKTTNTGSLNHWSFAGALDLTRNVSVGATLNIVTGKNDLSVDFFQDDEIAMLDDSIATKEVSFAEKPDYSGFNFKIGTLFRPAKNLRVALTVTAPTKITVSENYSESTTIKTDNDGYYSDSWYEPYKYHITAPWKFEIGSSYKYKLALFTGSVEWVDWQQTRFSSNIFDADGKNIDDAINNALLNDYRTSVNYRIGTEMVVPQIGCKVMAGYAYQQSPYKNGLEIVNSDHRYISVGASFLLDEQVKIDAAYQYGWWKQATTDNLLAYGPSPDYYNRYTSEKITSKKLLLSLSYRF